METPNATVTGSQSSAPAEAAPPSMPTEPSSTAAHTAPASSLFADVKDSLGRFFLPDKFRLKNGSPQLDTQGRFVPARLGAKRKADVTARANATPSASPAPAPKFDDVAAVLREKRASEGIPSADTAEPASAQSSPETLASDLANLGENPTAETIIGLIQTALVIIGDEEGLLTTLEKTTLRRPLQRVLDKYQVGSDAMGPEVDLALAVVALVAVRLQKPKTATAFQKIKAWFINAVFARRGAHAAEVTRRAVEGAAS